MQQKGGELGASLGGAGPHASVGQDTVAEIRIGRVDRSRDLQRAEEAEERPESVLDHQGVARPATCGHDGHRLAGQRGRIDQVEQVLEQAGIGTLVDRRADDEPISLLDRIEHAAGRQRQLVARPGRSQPGAGIDEVEDPPVEGCLGAGLVQHGVNQRAGLGRTLNIRAQPDESRSCHCSSLAIRPGRPARWRMAAAQPDIRIEQ
ncbi:hypothetical protein [Methylobacterium sp. WL1]|uniref:hypothetical protein n=1 Tax=Methylobacterium sp. WL1 TaxID=2603276 RepID=UPI002484AED9|nr:hypothetical protein [Methylobacterium sp. WL1]